MNRNHIRIDSGFSERHEEITCAYKRRVNNRTVSHKVRAVESVPHCVASSTGKHFP